MSTKLSSFIKWGEYTAKGTNIQDILYLEVIDVETFDTEYSVNVHVKQKINDSWEEKVLPLKSHESNNGQLLQLWNKAKRQGKIVSDAKFALHTYIGISKNNRPIRRFDLIF